MTWSLRRQIFYISLLFLFVFVFGFLIIYPTFKKAPSCNDFKQNGDEAGVDCGGSCILACTFEASPVSVLWARSFMVVPGRYNAVAYLENHNKNLAVDRIRYLFRFADKDNIYLGKREGVISIPPGRTFAVFERGIELGSSEPVYTSFSFTDVPYWLNVKGEVVNQIQLIPKNIVLENEDKSPHLYLDLKNESLFSIPDMNVMVILYDEHGNAINVSNTYIEEFKKEEEKRLDYTWQEGFVAKVVRKEILPMFNVFKVQIK